MRKYVASFAVVAVTLFGSLPVWAATATASPQVLGWIEEGIVQPENISVKIKMDTGALTSSMDAKDLQRFDKNGDEWVRFNVEVKDSDTQKQVSAGFERKVERDVKVRGAGGAEHRPVVLMNICIGKHIYNEEFSLKNRKNMNYPVLIGRKTLRKLGAIDVSKTFTLEPTCTKSSGSK
jgi:hypothetical protein